MQKPPLATSYQALTCLQDLLRQVQCYVERLPVDAERLFRAAHPHACSEPREALTQLLHFCDSALCLLSESLHVLEQRNQRWIQEQPLLQSYGNTQGLSNDPANWRMSAIYRLATTATENVVSLQAGNHCYRECGESAGQQPLLQRMWWVYRPGTTATENVVSLQASNHCYRECGESMCQQPLLQRMWWVYMSATTATENVVSLHASDHCYEECGESACQQPLLRIMWWVYMPATTATENVVSLHASNHCYGECGGSAFQQPLLQRMWWPKILYCLLLRKSLYSLQAFRFFLRK